MEQIMGQLLMVLGGLALCLLALSVMHGDATSRLTEAVLDRMEVALARREQQRRARSAGQPVNVSVFTHS